METRIQRIYEQLSLQGMDSFISGPAIFFVFAYSLTVWKVTYISLQEAVGKTIVCLSSKTEAPEQIQAVVRALVSDLHPNEEVCSFYYELFSSPFL